VLTLSVIVSGCSPWGVFRFYDGPERPLGEVAVLFVNRPPLNLLQIDGKKLSGSWAEYHLPPGEHSFVAFYSTEVDFASVSLTGHQSTSCDLIKGRCYRLEGKLRDEDGKPFSPDVFENPSLLLLAPPDKLFWQLKCTRLKTVGEVASVLAKNWRAPPHWSKLAERQLASKGGQQEQ